ncbi:hypothetical protein [Shewanella sp. SR43-8]|uniref:hypothetical protein n=1 Tax=Shewanella sp. SR43-8 TaxID=2760938 RepID=UPI0015FFBF93|nr:hypothetical protein [Shewanella sp. SR43-8]MBB1322114.1 hypothetical protein [Shewanella sp. SR43-8]
MDKNELIKGAGAGGFGLAVVFLLMNIQTAINEQRLELSELINNIDRRVTILETTHTIKDKEIAAYVQRSTH